MGFFSKSKPGYLPSKPSSAWSPPNIYDVYDPSAATASVTGTTSSHQTTPRVLPPPPTPVRETESRKTLLLEYPNYHYPPGLTPIPASSARPVSSTSLVPVSQSKHHHNNGPLKGCPLTSSLVNLAQDAMPGGKIYTQMYERLDDVLTMIDGENMCGDAEDAEPQPERGDQSRGALQKLGSTDRKQQQDRAFYKHITASVLSGEYFAKVELYANAKLPTDLSPLAL